MLEVTILLLFTFQWCRIIYFYEKFGTHILLGELVPFNICALSVFQRALKIFHLFCVSRQYSCYHP